MSPVMGRANRGQVHYTQHRDRDRDRDWRVWVVERANRVHFFKRLEDTETRISWPILLTVVLLCGLAARLSFSFYLSKFYFGTISFTFGDSFSYTECFLNLLNHGHYTFEIGNTDAYMYRGPAYPFFWGIHYLLVGPDLAYEAVAFSQSILDTGTGLLIFLILRHLNVSNALSVIGAALYLFNPLFIVHVPITGTETFATFITILIVYLTITFHNSTRWLFFVGIACGAAVLTRQYLGLLLPTIFLFLITSKNFDLRFLKKFILEVAVVGLGFASVIGPWHVRNLVNHDTNSFLMGKTTGYPSFQEDFLAFKDLYSLYFVNITPIRNSIAFDGTNNLSATDVPYTPFDKLDVADRLAYECGPSFLSWRGEEGYSQTQTSSLPNCKELVVSGYANLYEQTLENSPLHFRWKQPSLNIYKAVFKDTLVNPLGGWKDFVVGLIFSGRSVIVVGAFFSLFFLAKSSFKVFMLFPGALIFYISFVARQVEMRYLTQADAVMVIFFCLLCSSLWVSIFDKIRAKAIK